MLKPASIAPRRAPPAWMYFADSFQTERGRKVVTMFKKLGALKSHEKPQFFGSKRGVSIGEGAYDVVNFVVPAHFEAGDAQITLTLSKSGDKYLIHTININSDVFLN